MSKKLVIKEDGKIYAVVQNNKQKEILEKAFCSRCATHCINRKLRELNEESEVIYDRKWFVTKKPVSIKQVGVIVLTDEVELLKGVQFFDNKSNAQLKKEQFMKKHSEADFLELKLYTNVPLSEQKKSA